MTNRQIAAIPFLVAGVVLTWVANGLLEHAITEVNRKLPEVQKVPPYYGYPGKMGRVLRLHKQLYPGSMLPLWMHVIGFSGIALFVLGLALIGFLEGLFR